LFVKNESNKVDCASDSDIVVSLSTNTVLIVNVKALVLLQGGVWWRRWVGGFLGRTAVEHGQVGEVGPAALEQDGGVAVEAARRRAARVLQARRHAHGRHADGHTVALVTERVIDSQREGGFFPSVF